MSEQTEQPRTDGVKLPPLTLGGGAVLLVGGCIAIVVGVLAAHEPVVRTVGFTLGAVNLLTIIARTDLITRKAAVWQVSLYWAFVFLVVTVGAGFAFAFGGLGTKIVAAIIGLFMLATTVLGALRTIGDYRSGREPS